MKPIGPTFHSELVAAGLAGLTISIGGDGLIECHDQQGRLRRLFKDDTGQVQDTAILDTGAHPELTEVQIAALKACLSAHDPTPITFQGEQVWNAAAVDVVTAKRIRALVGGIDPIQEQLKYLRMTAAAQDVVANAGSYTQAEIDAANAFLVSMRTENAQIEAIRAEGKTFKQSKGWA